MRFPLYFQATQPSFEIDVQRISEEEPKLEELKFHITFANEAYVTYGLDVSSLNVGDRTRLRTGNTLLAPTGDTSIRWDMGRSAGFLTLYAFYVSPETALVFLLLNVVFGVAFTTVVALALRFL